MTTPTPNWWMYHGDSAHSGHYPGPSAINAKALKAGQLTTHQTLELGGPILAIPTIVDGHIYVGIANSAHATGMVGGSVLKIDIDSGKTLAQYTWDIALDERDSHGFTGMGSSIAVVQGRATFTAFNGKVYCLDADTLAPLWITDLRKPDPAHKQPLNNHLQADNGYPPAAGWSSVLAVNGKIYLGMGEGENPALYAYVYQLDAASGDLDWFYCTSQFQKDQINPVNQAPIEAYPNGNIPDGFSAYHGEVYDHGACVWGAIAYDPDTQLLYCPTGNAVPDTVLPSKGWSNGLLALHAQSGQYHSFYQAPPDSSYRPSDLDVDIGASPTVFTRNGQKVVGVASKNGSYFILDAHDVSHCLQRRQMLPYTNAGDQIETVDPHSDSRYPNDPDQPNPRVSNQTSNSHPAENYSGSYSTGAIHPDSGTLFVGVGGNNYHTVAPGIDSATTPFMRALKTTDLSDAWPMDEHDPRRYKNARPPMYTTPAESGLSSPAVVNDLVFMGTTGVSLHAFHIQDGSHLWSDPLGEQTGGLNGGYGYCMGPAIWGDYLVAGGLVYGRDGGILRIYKATPTSDTPT